MTTWLVPLRAGDDNEELRYSLRSWVQNAGMSEREDCLVTVGHLPSWLKPDVHIGGNTHRSGPANVYTNLRDACSTHFVGPESIIIGNDDMFAMDPVDPRAIAYRGSLREHVLGLPQSHRVSWWSTSLRLTLNLLKSRGIAAPLSYELHRPLLVDPGRLAEILHESWSGNGVPVQWRSMYGNLASIGGAQDVDGKIVNRATFPPCTPWWSTIGGSWRWVSRDHVIERFPIASRWES